MHASKCPRLNDRMIGRAAPTNMWVMSIQYDFSERMVLLTADATYIQRRQKIKNKLASLEKNQMNKEIVAQRRLSQQENCVENSPVVAFNNRYDGDRLRP
jgi:hypothetical protein